MSGSNVDWYFITEQISQHKFAPIISDQVVSAALFSGQSVVRAWADKISYPLADSDNLTRVAQFFSVTIQDPSQAKSSYLRFLKQSLLELARGWVGADAGFLDEVKNELRELTFSELAIDRLHYPDFKEAPDNPLRLLAALPIPIYLTTSYHHFMEAALKAADKTPRTQIYCWREELDESIPSQFRTDPAFQPDVQTPLVYHLHGVDDYPDSLVLTEDDYLKFLVNVAQDFNTDAIPSRVRNALSSSLLLLLGYDLQAWDLRVLMQGLGLAKDKPLRPTSFAIQLVPAQETVKNPQQFQEYLQKYFGQSKFDVYWGDPQSFMETLWKEWEAG
jgi:hypothetical protein